MMMSSMEDLLMLIWRSTIQRERGRWKRRRMPNHMGAAPPRNGRPNGSDETTMRRRMEALVVSMNQEARDREKKPSRINCSP